MTTIRTVTPVGPELPPKEGGLPGDGREYKTVSVGDETVYVSHSTMRRGTSPNGKTWCRFQNNSMEIVSWRSGRLRSYQKTRSKKGTYIFDTTAQFIEAALDPGSRGSYILTRDMREALQQKTGMKPDAVVLKDYPLAANIPAGPGVTPLLASRDISEFTLKLFGKSRYRKDLVRGVGRMAWLPNGGTEHLKLLKAFSTFTPTDWIARYLEDLPTPNVYTSASKLSFGGRPLKIVEVRRALRTATPKQIRRLVTVGQMPIRAVEDSMRTLNAIWSIDSSYRLDALRFGNWDELHDLLPVELRKMRHHNQAVEYPKKAQKLIGTHGEYEIIGTPDTWTLSEWGRTMNNCIGGYGSAAVSQRSLLFAVIKDGKMLANMEIAPDGTIRQLVGKHNGYLEAKDDLAIRAAVYEVWPMSNVSVAFGRAGAGIDELGAAAQGVGNFRWEAF